MKAISQSNYGSIDVLSLQEVDKPVVTDKGVLVKVQAASVNSGDWHLMRGTPFLSRLMFGGILKPKIKTLGMDVAGRVEAIGKDVTQFQINDEVFGDISGCGFGAFAEYVCADESALVLKPSTTSFEQAATVPAAALAALQGLRDLGQIQSGQKVLINGASGGVGSFAVQIAKAFGAEVTALCSTKKMAMVQSLGADHVIDYTQVDVTKSGERYNLILDAAAYRSVFHYLPILSSYGSYVLVGGSIMRLFQIMFFGALISKISRRNVKCLSSKPNQKDLTILSNLLESGKISPFISQRCNLSEVPTAISALEQRQVMGKIAITM
ncbi:NAD(P)-dependent alcohol dehydrogenase [Pseudanabaena sp. ABRG5-3]|uniref:NAD(P)-dependent alcohol dehydrogenase n=1 Tax=Pseudanabaena sp. ABRG5-3 TaxID=685565 RepID=UPI000DC70310|nr:NAD(P)-dependent alcohol dehydrogenase [Pseudanabaena sp. ABRG5-3]BBC27116.1 NADPH:quinone reductase/Zn-dependent oxidoreductase [Pseudanabaena sp. ABRG5-3]